MQTIRKIIKISGLSSCVADETGRKLDPPEFKVGVAAALELDLRSDKWDYDTGELDFYPYSDVAGCDSYYIAMDGDWDHDTQPKIIKTSGIGVSQDASGRTLLRAGAPNLAIPGVIELLSNKQVSPVVTCEIGGFRVVDGAAECVFAISFSMRLENRIWLGGDPGCAITNDPAYLTAAEVMALIADATRSATPGPSGASAYQIAVAGGYEGTAAEWLASLKGAPGDGGLSAYDLAVAGGYEGTVATWLAALRGASAYEVALEQGYEGTVSEWLASLKGADGAGLYFDRTGTVVERALYDNEAAGFKFAATVVDSSTQTTTLYIWAKNSAAYADWCTTPVAIAYSASSGANVSAIAPAEFTPPSGADLAWFRVPFASYPLATVAAVTIDTDEGEVTLPYYSDFGVRKILRRDDAIYVYFGSSLPTYTRGRIYFTQLIGASSVSALESDKMYYGYITDGTLLSVTGITPAMISAAVDAGTLTEADAGTLVKTSIGTVPAGSWVVALVPAAGSLVVTKYDGIAGRAAFAANNGASDTGANGGATVTVSDKQYKVFGEFKLNTAEVSVYVD